MSNPGGLSAAALPPELDPRGPRRPGAGEPSGGKARRVAGWIAGLTALLVLGISGIGWAALTFYDAKITRVDVGIDSSAPQPGAPVNILLVGSDSRAGLSQAEKNKLSTGNETTKRSDTMILAHVSADNQNVTLVSFPRDSLLTIPAHTSANGDQIGETKNKLNAAFAFGGPALTIDTIEKNTGLTIDHYVEVDIAGFVRVVDALGGADVCVKKDVYDKDSGLDLAAGKHRLDGAEALAYVRARKIYADSDIGRIRAQQAFIGSLARKALSAQTLADPIKLNRFLNASLSSVSTDKSFDRGQLISLADRLRETSASQIRFVTVPLSDLDYRVDGVGSSVLWDEEKADKIFTALKNDEPLVKPKPAATAGATDSGKVQVAPGGITVQALNGTTITGLGGKAADSLAKVGFGMAGLAKNADRSDYARTTIQYDPRYTKSLATLTASMPYAATEAVEGLGKTFNVIAGTDWNGAEKVTVASSSPTPKATTSTKDGLESTTAAQTTCT
jgi:LCP family protein required for cell wall assembly